jgi:CBS domain-containing membrane protein
MGIKGESAAPRIALNLIALSGVTSFAGVGTLSMICCLWSSSAFMLLGSFGATAALVFGAPEAPFSQPRNVIGGHVISATVGSTIYAISELVGMNQMAAAPFAVSGAIMGMLLTRTFHPPAAGTALISIIGSEAIHDLGIAYAIPAGTGQIHNKNILYLIFDSFRYFFYKFVAVVVGVGVVV